METPKGTSRAKVVFALLVASIVIVAGIVAASYNSPSTANSSTTGTLTASSPSGELGSTASQTQTSETSGTQTTAETSVQTHGPGPISTFPATWDNPCGFPVNGTRTTEVLNSLPWGNLSMGQVYYRIVNSSVFETLAAGRTWVTVQWAGFQLSNITGSYTVLTADFMFVSGGFPNGFAQMDYFLGSGDVTVGFSSPSAISTCPPVASSSYGASLVGSIGRSASYQAGEAVGINLTVSDGTIDNMNITSATSCLGNFTVLQESGTNATAVYASAKHPLCTGPPLTVVLNPQQTYSQLVEWNQTDDAGAQVPPGTYEVMASVGGEQGQVLVLAGVVTIDAP